MSVQDIPNNILVENLTNNSCMSISEIAVNDDLTNDILDENIENKQKNLDSLPIEKYVKGNKKKKTKWLKRKGKIIYNKMHFADTKFHNHFLLKCLKVCLNYK